MEQYWMPKKLDFKNLRMCLDNYKTEFLYIRLVGSKGGTVKVNETLERRTLNFKKDKSGLYLLIDSNEVFHFPLKDYHKGFSLAYERIIPTEDGIGRMVYLSTGVDPYNPELPEPRKSFLRTVLDDHLLEIFFKGRVHLKFHSWWEKPHWKYWTVAGKKDIPKIVREYEKRVWEEIIKKEREEAEKLQIEDWEDF